MVFARHVRKPGRRNLAALAGCTLALSALVLQGGMQSASADEYNQYTDAPTGKATLPLPDDVILNYASGEPVASHYKFSYICPTNPDDVTALPDNIGVPGVPQKYDTLQYQSAPCYFGVPKGEDILDTAEIDAAFHGVRELYGLAPWFEEVPTVVGQLNDLYGANTPLSDIQANCPRQGPPVTSFKDPVGTCLQHMNVLHFPNNNNASEPQYHVPNQVPLPAHSHILGDYVSKNIGKVSTKESPTRLGPSWWHPRSVQVLDRAIWPDAAGNCPAGREKCLTSIKALRAAQKSGQARTEGGSNILLYFSVQPIEQSGFDVLNSFSTNFPSGAINPQGVLNWKEIQEKNFGSKESLARVKALTDSVKTSLKAESKKAKVTAPRTAPTHEQMVAARKES